MLACNANACDCTCHARGDDCPCCTISYDDVRRYRKFQIEAAERFHKAYAGNGKFVEI